MKTRLDLEEQEHRRLAPYAQFSSRSAGRIHPESPHPCLTAYQDDRTRIIHSRAFRRLANKTQVFLSGTGDHLRTRLTHTMEVVSTGRAIAAALGANEDLVECICLCHDLGHPPFGHPGESLLNRLMQHDGGFEHNLQSLRIVEQLDQSFPAFPGLNLSHEVREALHKRAEPPVRPAFAHFPARRFPSPSLEAQIADLADDITYYAHDLEDGLDHRLIHLEQLEELELWQLCRAQVQAAYPQLRSKHFHLYVIRQITSLEIADAVAETQRQLRQSEVSSADAVRELPASLVAPSQDVARANRELRRFLRENLYAHPAVASPNQQGCLMIEQLFAAYLEHPSRMGSFLADAPRETPVPRVVCDYLSGMTDRFLESEYRRVCSDTRPQEGSASGMGAVIPGERVRPPTPRP